MIATAEQCLAGAIERANEHAPFLRGLLERCPDLRDLLLAGKVEAALAAVSNIPEDLTTASALRVERARLALMLAIGDLAGLLAVEDVMESLSDFADRALDRAVAAAIAERTPGDEPRGFAVIALGKHGSRELNYSSDIDPILLFDPETLPRRPREEPGEAAVRIGRRVVELMQARDADGYVFRVDLRLRPSPEVTPIVLPVEAAIGYYESSAEPWERAAFIRARPAAGDVTLGQSFLESIQPFVWRRSLDFGAIRDIRGISRRIREHHEGQAFGPGYDLKRGRGGIREIEFFAQIHQLIHGGREPSLRVPATMPALAALAEAGRIAPREADALIEAYRLFRTVEHRLQMVEDRQTHRLPADPAALDNVARLDGLKNGPALLDRLLPHVAQVGKIYDALEEEGRERLPRDAGALGHHLAQAGFDPPDDAMAAIARWRSGGFRAVQSPAARAALEDVLPGLVKVLGRAPDPNAALRRLDEMLSKLPSAINIFRLLEARPALARLLADILSYAPALAAQLGRRPELLDGLIDASALELPASVEVVRTRLRHGGGEDYERLLDHVRRGVNERRFALGVQLIEGTSDPIAVAGGYSRVAEAALDVLASAAVAEQERAHGRVPGGELVVLALGRFGGEALTNASDLDLVYLFTGDYLASSDGPRPVEATRYFNRLAQRVISALTVPTAAGPLYEVDTRLRPSGGQGLLAVSVDSFAQYQRENAWTWEHMALARARPVFGSAEARAAVEKIISETLNAARDGPKLLKDAVSMRADIARHKPPAGSLDVKLVKGGLVDLEFCVHVAQLEHRTGFDPHLPVAIAALAQKGLLPAGFAQAHDVLTRMLVTLRLVSPDLAEPPPPVQKLVARACGMPDWAALLAAYEEARQMVADEWRRIVARSEEE